MLLKEEGAEVTVLDSAEEPKLPQSTLNNLRGRGVSDRVRPAAESDSTAYSLAFSVPGSIRRRLWREIFFPAEIPMIGELELGWRFCQLPVIAITGTNGKTTTTEMIAQILNACGKRTIACGNIGKPLSEIARRKNEFDLLTVEVSSFQLETIETFIRRSRSG